MTSNWSYRVCTPGRGGEVFDVSWTWQCLVGGGLEALEMEGKDNAGMYAMVAEYLPRSAATLTKIDMRFGFT